MKLRSLELRRFGRFEDRVIDFDPGASLHIVYGPNEAGKTTMLDALTFALYGYSRRKDDRAYAFRFAKPSLRVALAIDKDDGTPLRFMRRRGDARTVHDPVSDVASDELEAQLAGLLRGTDRDIWTLRHGISRDGLRRGGQQLAERGSDANDVLFSVASGISVMRAVLADVRAQRDRLLSKSGGKGELATALKTYKAAREQLDRARVDSSTYDRDVADRERIVTQLEVLDQTRRKLVIERQLLQHVHDASRLLFDHTELATRLDDLAEPPISWEQNDHDEFAAALAADEQTALQLDQIASRMQTLEAQVAELTVDDEVLGASETIARLGKRVGSVDDAARLQVSLAARAESANAALITAARTYLDAVGDSRDVTVEAAQQVAAELPAVALRRQVRELAEAGRALEQTRRQADQLLDAATREFARLDERADAASISGDTSMGELRSLIGQAHKVSPDAIRRSAAKLASEHEALAQRARALPGCNFTIEQLLATALPANADIDRVGDQIDALTSQRDAERERLDQARTHLASKREQLSAFEAERHLPDPARLESVRHDRDALWQRLRADLARMPDPDAIAGAVHAAPAIEQAITAADACADQLLNDAHRVGQAAAIREQIAADELREQQARERIEQISEQLTTVETTAWRELWSGCDITISTPDAMRELVLVIRELRRDVQHLRDAEVDHAAMLQQVREIRDHLSSLLNVDVHAKNVSGDELTSFSVLVDQAEQTLNEHEHQRDERIKLESLLTAARERRDAAGTSAAQAADEQAAWHASWQSTCAAFSGAAGDDITNMLRVVESMDELDAAAASARDRRNELRATRDQIDGFARDVQQLLASIGDSVTRLRAQPPDLAVGELLQRAGEATEAHGARRALQQQQRRLSDERATIDAARQHSEQRLSAIIAAAGDGDLTRREIIDIDRLWADRRAVTDQMRDINAQLLELTRHSADELLGIRGDRSIEQLVADIARIDDTIADHDAQISNLRTQRDDVIGRIRSIESSPAELDAQQRMNDALATVERLVPEYRSLCLQEQQLAQFMEQRSAVDRGPVIALASEYLQQLTCGSFAGIELNVADSDVVILQARRTSDNELVSLDGLSEGSRDQLYLALRLATLVTALDQQAETMPLIVDDLLITFDDERSRATLRLLGDISARMQVVFFTHHERLVELAEASVAPDMLDVQRL